MRPRGVTPGIWAYTNERSIADRYDAFVADTPLCRTDRTILHEIFLPRKSTQSVTIVDLGCGSGRTAMDLAARGYSVTGVDLSQSMLETMRQKSSGHSHISAVRANLVELDCFAADSFDHAVCMFSTLGMIEGRANRRRLLSRVAGIVAPGGRFVLHVHHRWAALGEPGGVRRLVRSWWRSKRSAYQGVGNHEFGDATYAYRGIEDMFMHRFSRRELLRDLNVTGWGIDKLYCLSIDGSKIIDPPRIRRHRIGGFIVVAIHA